METTKYSFDLKAGSPSIIKVIGVGGGGSNAVNHMFRQYAQDVDFVVCNTDLQALKNSPVHHKIQIGVQTSQGLGAGANPEKGKAGAIENKEEIRQLLSEDTKMVFITAGMGGGTGTGAAPEIARVARELGILTVGIVTLPFAFEGRKKKLIAEAGLAELKKHCDTVLVILNEKLRQIFNDLTLSNAFAQADNVLASAARSISDIITMPGHINVDFEDVKTVMSNSGSAVMGTASANGKGRAEKAAKAALSSPLLDNKNIKGAEKILLSIKSGDANEMKMEELETITAIIQEEIGEEAEMIFGHGIDATLEDNIMVTIIATGFCQVEQAQPVQTEKTTELPTQGQADREMLTQREHYLHRDKNLEQPEANNEPCYTKPAYQIPEEEEIRDNSFDLERMQVAERYRRMKEEAVMRRQGKSLTSEQDIRARKNPYADAMYEEPAYLRKKYAMQSSIPADQVKRYLLEEDEK